MAFTKPNERQQQPRHAANRPVFKITLWPLSASIWKQTGTNGDFYNVTLQRSYKDGETWKNSDSFGRDDLLAAAKLLDQAHSWIVRAEHAAREQEGQ